LAAPGRWDSIDENRSDSVRPTLSFRRESRHWEEMAACGANASQKECSGIAAPDDENTDTNILREDTSPLRQTHLHGMASPISFPFVQNRLLNMVQSDPVRKSGRRLTVSPTQEFKPRPLNFSQESDPLPPVRRRTISPTQEFRPVFAAAPCSVASPRMLWSQDSVATPADPEEDSSSSTALLEQQLARTRTPARALSTEEPEAKKGGLRRLLQPTVSATF